MEPLLQEANTKVENALSHLKKELATIRAGRANPTLLEDVPVSVYGTKMKLVELGTISAPQPSLLTVQIWDASIVKDVEKAILEANLGLNPSVDGQMIRVPIPPLSEERREEFIKLTSQKGEQVKVEIRQIRHDQRSGWEKDKEQDIIGEDEWFRRDKILQELIDKAMSQVNELVQTKEEDLRQI